MRIEPREYQQKAVDYAMSHGKDDRIIHCAPTGSGKTVMQGLICKRGMDRGDSTAILTPRNEIFTQTHSMVSGLCGERNVSVLRAMRKGERWNPMNPVHIVSWPTMISRARKSNFFFPRVDRVQVDEAHLSVAPKILEILEHYAPKAIIDAWTATPARQSGKGLGDFFTSIKNVTTVRQLIKDGYLAPVEYWGGATPDMQGIKIVRGDYEVGKLSKASQKLVGDVVDNWLRLAAERHTIVFAVDIAHCEMLAHKFKEVGIKAAPLHVRMDQDDRDEVVRQFKSGAIQVLVNVSIASYGFDAPSVDCVVVARKTRSIVLHLQMIGRGMRPAVDEDGNRIADPNDPRFKTCMVLDHAGNVHELGMADDLFRWRLEEGKKACDNWSRMEPSGEKEKSKTHTCEQCQHVFSQSRVCPKCGWKVPFSKRDVEVVEADLVRIGKKMVEKLPEGWPSHEVFYQMLIRYGAEKGYKPGWAAVKFKEKAGVWPERHWMNLPSVPPSKRILNWIISRNIAYAKARKADNKKSG
jgi:superfamily II DNA or RNA helicase